MGGIFFFIDISLSDFVFTQGIFIIIFRMFLMVKIEGSYNRNLYNLKQIGAHVKKETRRDTQQN